MTTRMTKMRMNINEQEEGEDGTRTPLKKISFSNDLLCTFLL
jgi:hypothetical protein